MPIIISKMPKPTKNISGGMKGKVSLSKDKTIELAGLTPTTFKIPNQKKIRKIAKRAKGKNISRM